jgi:hypothetical protein
MSDTTTTPQSQDFTEAIKEAFMSYDVGQEFFYKDISALVGCHETTASHHLTQAAVRGELVRLTRGRYKRTPPKVAPQTIVFEVLKKRDDGSLVFLDPDGYIYVARVVDL